MFSRETARYVYGVVLFVLVSIASVTPIWSYDYFWHLTAGRWIIDHHMLPEFDPLAVASAHVPWINGEWLYEIILAPLYSLVGHAGVSIINALLIAGIFTLTFALATRDHDSGTALFVAAIAFAGACDRFGVRPAVMAALLVVITVGLLRSEMPIWRLATIYAGVSVVWINVHPSALLAPVLALVTMLRDVRRWIVAVASALVLLVNPYGWNAILALTHLEVANLTGASMNEEWLPSPVRYFPLLYVTLAAGLILFVWARGKRANAWRLAIFLILGLLAVRHVRNQSLYFVAFPLLVPPFRVLSRGFSTAIAGLALIPLGWSLQHDTHRPGVNDVRFPVRAVTALRSYGLSGNIYNADQFGGLIEWTFYPERRALTDGRNELFLEYIAENARARTDFEAWEPFLVQHDVTLAVDAYRPNKINVIDPTKGEERMMPESLIRYHRRKWALIAFDDAAMVFARRDAFAPARLAAIEYRYIVPDDPTIHYATAEIRAAAQAEVARAREQFGDIEIVRKLERGINQ